MKRSMKIAFMTFASTVLMLSVGCSNNGTNPEDSRDGTDALTTIMDNSSTDLTPICPDGQFPNDDGVTPYGSPMGDDHRGLKGGRDDRGPKDGIGMRDTSRFGQLHRILPCLTLTADQLTQLRSLMEGFRTSAHQIMSDTRAAEQPFRTDADEQVKTIRDQVLAGTMTRDSARVAIQAIRTQLIADTKPLRDAARAAIADLQNGLLPQIRAILTADQQAIWDAWMTSGTVPCTRPPHHGKGHR
ncbi:MAG: hypothetical protein IPM69_02070 [Ignavibacteria bacterium]|nr:hypothetical protein [Ignavibacteria bacterium]